MLARAHSHTRFIRSLSDWSVAGMLACLGIGGAAAQPVAPSIEIFAALPVQADAVLSPGGHWIAWMEHQNATTRVVIFDLAARKTHRVVAIPARGTLRALAWNDEDTLLAGLSEYRRGDGSDSVDRRLLCQRLVARLADARRPLVERRRVDPAEG